MADEPNELERLVAQRIREQLGEEGGLERLIEGRREILGVSGRIEAQLKGVKAQFGGSGRLSALAGVVVSPEPAVLVLRTEAPKLANDIEGRSTRDIKLALELYMTFLTALLVVLLTRPQTFHQQAPNPTEIIDLFNQMTNVAQTIDMQDKGQTERLVNAMFTQSSTVTSAAALQAKLNAEARQELIDEFGLYDSEQVAHIAGSTAKNRSAIASRWLAAGRLFAIEYLGSRYYPTFQFGTNGRPKPIIKPILEALRPYGLDGWEIALWFTTATGWLDDERPVDRLTTTPDLVVEAAQHTFDEVAG